MEQMLHRQKLTNLSLFILSERRLKTDLETVYKYLDEKQNKTKSSLKSSSRINAWKQKAEKLIRKNNVHIFNSDFHLSRLSTGFFFFHSLGCSSGFGASVKNRAFVRSKSSGSR